MPRVDEKRTRYSGRVSVLYFWRRYLIAALLLAVGLYLHGGAEAGAGPGLAWAAPWLIAAGAGLPCWTLAVVFFGARYWVTSDHVVHSLGVVSRHTHELEIGRVSDVEIRQGWIERLLNIGSIWLRTGEREGSAVTLSGIRDPEALAQLIREPTPGYEAPSVE